MSKYKKDSRSFFDSVAEKKYGNSEKLDNKILSFLSEKKNFKILDLGCGSGRTLSLMAEKGYAFTGAGIDISENMIRLAKKRNLENVVFSLGDSECLPYEDDSFDVIICINSFHHYSNPDKVVSELRRVLRSEGDVILGDIWVPDPFRSIINMFLPFTKKGDYKIYSKTSIDTLFRPMGFHLENFHILPSLLFVAKFSIKNNKYI